MLLTLCLWIIKATNKEKENNLQLDETRVVNQIYAVSSKCKRYIPSKVPMLQAWLLQAS